MTQIPLHTAVQRKEKKKACDHLQEQLGSQGFPAPWSFSISEQDTTKSLEKNPQRQATFQHQETHFLFPTGSTHCQALKSWIATIIPNDYIKTFLNYGYRYMFWTEVSDISSYQIIKEKNDAWNTGGPEGGLLPK